MGDQVAEEIGRDHKSEHDKDAAGQRCNSAISPEKLEKDTIKRKKQRSKGAGQE